MDYARVKQLLDAGPGPSPWYLWRRSMGVSPRHGPLMWRELGKGSDVAGFTSLRREDGADLLLLDFYCYTLPLDGGRLLIWRQSTGRRDGVEEHVPIEFKLIDVEALEPIADAEATAVAARESRRNHVLCTGGLLHAADIPMLHLREGSNECRVPSKLQLPDELLTLCYIPGVKTTAEDIDGLAIVALRPSTGHCKVYPQDWWNREGRWDRGHEWCTRVARDPETGRIVGEGIRMCPFVLDVTGRQVEQWFQDPKEHVTPPPCPDRPGWLQRMIDRLRRRGSA